MKLELKLIISLGVVLFLAGLILDILGFNFYLWFPLTILGFTGIFMLPCYWILKG